MVDHVDQASVCLEVSQSNGSQAAAAAAVAHATLALVEQQRTANLIAYLGLALSDVSDITDKAGLQQVADDIVQGLGGAKWIGRFR